MSTTKTDLEAMSVDELWTLHEKVTRILSARITLEKQELEKRLAVLNGSRKPMQDKGDRPVIGDRGKVRRKYPRVLPKYRNPQMPSETWSGRGKLPRWLVAAMKSGRKMEDFRIGEGSGAKSRR